MRKVSATQIKTYKSCRQQYFDRYVVKKQLPQSTISLLGTALHKAIEMYYTRGEPPIATFSKNVRNTLNNWQDKELTVDYSYSQAEIIETGLDIIRNFPFSDFKCKFSEMSFNIPFFDMATIVGVIDMVTQDGGIIDFKSSKSMPKRSSFLKDPQFLIYPWAYHELFGEWPSYVVWYHLRTQEKLEFTYDADLFQSEVVETVKQMAADKFDDLTGDSCSKCVPWCYRYGNRE